MSCRGLVIPPGSELHLCMVLVQSGCLHLNFQKDVFQLFFACLDAS